MTKYRLPECPMERRRRMTDTQEIYWNKQISCRQNNDARLCVCIIHYRKTLNPFGGLCLSLSFCLNGRSAWVRIFILCIALVRFGKTSFHTFMTCHILPYFEFELTRIIKRQTLVISFNSNWSASLRENNRTISSECRASFRYADQPMTEIGE